MENKKKPRTKKIKTSEPIIEAINYYEILPKKYLEEQITYDNQKKINISLPCNIAIIGYTGSGKSNFLMNFIDNIGCFNKITLYAKNLQEPLYKYLIDRIKLLEKETGVNILDVYDNIDDVRPADTYDTSDNNLVIFDDVINEGKKKLTNLNNLFTLGRKNNITTVFISQSYFDIPSIIRKNCQILVILKIKNKNDITRILRDNTFDMTADELISVYNFIRNKLGDKHFLLLDSKTNNPDLKVRIDYTGVKDYFNKHPKVI